MSQPIEPSAIGPPMKDPPGQLLYTKNGHTEILKWAIENNCDYAYERLKALAVIYYRPAITKWLV